MQDSTATYFIIPDSTAAAAGTAIPETPLPMDSAFTGGILALSRTDRTRAQAGQEGDGIAMEILVGIAILTFLLTFNKFINILPYIFGCMLRWKESVHVEDSMQIRRSRNWTALILVAPFCMIAAKYSFIPQLTVYGYSPIGKVLATFAVLVAYLIIRMLSNLLGKTIPCRKSVYETATSVSRTFFCIYTVLALVIAGIMSVSGFTEELTGTVLLYALASVYFIFLIRKSQIFKNSCSLFYTFLYLCTLEILPTSILVATVMFL